MTSSFSDQPTPRGPEREEPRADTDGGNPPPLGSLAQAARGKQLNQARVILFVIGALTILANGIFMALARDNVKKEIEAEINKQGGRGNVLIDQRKLQEIEDQTVQAVMLINGVAVFLGVLFVIFGFLVKAFPVPVTVLSLVLYIGAALVFGALDPSTLVRGIIIKIIIVIGLVKALQAAFAYEKEKRAAAEQALGY